ncbi:MAG: methyltransferase domain-containing protein [Nitrospinae bacterium]|nr:methyltransferase domain-containing protein [Nitrospinota bacterium]
MTDSQDPLHQLNAKNPWYIDDHFQKQYNQPGPRAVIENRWKIFENAIEEFLGSNKTTPQTPIRILDAGCGDGINLLGLNNMAQAKAWNVSIYGSDYNPMRLERAAKFSFVEEINLSPLDNLPYADDWFDVVLCNHVIEHIPNDKNVLLELKRVLRPSGLLILGVPNEGCALAWLRNHVIQRSILKTTDHVNFYTEKTISNFLTHSGFSISSIEKAGFFLPHLALNYLISITKPGRVLLKFLGRIFPSQSAEVMVTSLNK